MPLPNKTQIFFLFIFLVGFTQCKQDQGNTDVQDDTDNALEEKLDSTKLEKLTFYINIDAPIEKVYQTVIDSVAFREWTTDFSPVSYFEGDWQEGSKMLFISEMEDGSTVGMVSHIKHHVPKQIISIEHMGVYENGKEIMEGEEVESFKGSVESYSFSTNGEVTTMVVETDIFVEQAKFFNETWPKALDRIKALCEN